MGATFVSGQAWPPLRLEAADRLAEARLRVEAVGRAMRDVRTALESNLVTACWHEQNQGEAGKLHGCVVVKAEGQDDRLVWFDLSLSAD